MKSIPRGPREIPPKIQKKKFEKKNQKKSALNLHFKVQNFW